MNFVVIIYVQECMCLFLLKWVKEYARFKLLTKTTRYPASIVLSVQLCWSSDRHWFFGFSVYDRPSQLSPLWHTIRFR